MSRRPERIVLLRSGRHLSVALGALGARWPGCHVTVVATAGTEAAVEAAGVARADTLVYEGRPRFEPGGLLATGIAWRLWRRGYDRVAVLWLDPYGSDRSNVDRSALLLSPRGFAAVTPDGRLFERRTTATIRREAGRAARSLAVAAGLALFAYAPAAIVRAYRRLRAAHG
ncbi:MAG: hypothetical protein AB1635_07870 [Acidobacteriota bacterium]